MRSTLVFDYVDSADTSTDNGDLYYNYYDPYFDDQASPMWLTWDFQGILMAIALAAVAILLISALWNYCANDDESPAETLTQQSTQPIVVHELRPGLIVMKGYPSHEETLRIAAEYDAIRSGPGQASFSHYHSTSRPYSSPGQYLPTQYVQPASRPEGHPHSHSLINLMDTDNRPPPYAPEGQDPNAIPPPRPASIY